MFCHKCGNKSSEGSIFCEKCGARLIDGETAPESVRGAGSTSAGEPVESTQAAVAAAPISSPEQAAPAAAQNAFFNGDNELLRALIGNNSEYYLTQFARIDKGEKSFNWLAFIFAPILLLYRKQFAYFKKMLLPVYGALLAQLALSTYATASFNIGLISAVPVIGVLVAVYAIVTAYLCGKNFNMHYQASLNALVADYRLNATDESAMNKHKPSALAPVLFIGAYLVASLILGAAVGAIAANSWRESPAPAVAQNRSSGATRTLSAVTIVNDTSYVIYFVYISPSTTSGWGEDLLGASTVRGRQELRVNLPSPINLANQYDIQAVDEDGDTYTKWNVLIPSDGRIVFTWQDMD